VKILAGIAGLVFTIVQVANVLNMNGTASGRVQSSPPAEICGKIIRTGERMTSNARQKIDGFTRQMFDVEVDKPGHDQVLTAFFQDDAAHERIFSELHQIEPLRPANEYESFKVFDSNVGVWRKRVTFADACKLTGKKPPKWKSLSPYRPVSKQLECLLNYTSDEGRASRLMGFIDVAIRYDILQPPHVELGREYRWVVERKKVLALVEVKGEWPSAGNLIRQLNLYRSCWPRSFSDFTERRHLVLGPNDEHNELVNQHGYDLLTFGAAGKEFQLVPRVFFKREKEPEGVI